MAILHAQRTARLASGSMIYFYHFIYHARFPDRIQGRSAVGRPFVLSRSHLDFDPELPAGSIQTSGDFVVLARVGAVRGSHLHQHSKLRAATDRPRYPRVR
jgi:hypothetical protein